MTSSSSTPNNNEQVEIEEEEEESTVKFGNREAVEEVRKLTDVGAMTRFLHECIAYQRVLDLDLDNLDQAQSRVNHTLLRIDAIVERSNCLDGVRKALHSEDFESTAQFVQTFLQIDDKYKDTSGSDQRDQLLAAKKQLQTIIRKRLSSAIDQRDHPVIL